MARRRSISVDVSTDERLDALSPEAEILFLRAIPHADDFGRLDGEPYKLKTLIVPGRPWTVENLKCLRDELVKIGLWQMWTVNKKTVVSYNAKSWDQHQDGLHKRTSSKFPDPPGSPDPTELPGNSGKFREFQRRSEHFLPEAKRSETNRTETNRSVLSEPLPSTVSPEPHEESPRRSLLRLIQTYLKAQGNELTTRQQAELTEELAELRYSAPVLIQATRYAFETAHSPPRTPKIIVQRIRSQAESLAHASVGKARDGPPKARQ